MRISDWSSDVCSSDLLWQIIIGRIDADDANPSIGKINRIPIDDPGTWRRQSCFRDFDERLLVLRDCIGCHDQERRPHRPSLEPRSEEHTSELQSLMRISYAVFCLKKKKKNKKKNTIDKCRTHTKNNKRKKKE